MRRLRIPYRVRRTTRRAKAVMRILRMGRETAQLLSHLRPSRANQSSPTTIARCLEKRPRPTRRNVACSSSKQVRRRGPMSVKSSQKSVCVLCSTWLHQLNRISSENDPTRCRHAQACCGVSKEPECQPSSRASQPRRRCASQEGGMLLRELHRVFLYDRRTVVFFVPASYDVRVHENDV